MNSGRIRKVSNIGCFDTLFPFVSFYMPDHASGRLAAAGEDAVI
uniref:Uncharacterized protein n=1 Tax=Arundo donax TaxID=35708 RepID=A0A0A8Y7C7_ARUDO